MEITFLGRTIRRGKSYKRDIEIFNKKYTDNAMAKSKNDKSHIMCSNRNYMFEMHFQENSRIMQ